MDTSKPIWMLTVAEFIELQNSLNQLSKSVEPVNTPKQEEYLTVSETAKYLGISKPTLWRWSKMKYLEPVKVGGILRYKKSELENLTSNKPKV